MSLAFLTFLHVIIKSTDLHGRINTKNIKSLKVYLNNSHETRTDSSGSFSFYNMSSGNYLLTIPDNTYYFNSYLIFISKKKKEIYEVDEKRGLHIPLTNLSSIEPRDKKEYFELEKQFDPSSFLRGPYGIMIVISCGLLLFIKNTPKMESLQNVDRP